MHRPYCANAYAPAMAKTAHLHTHVHQLAPMPLPLPLSLPEADNAGPITGCREPRPSPRHRCLRSARFWLLLPGNTLGPSDNAGCWGCCCFRRGSFGPERNPYNRTAGSIAGSCGCHPSKYGRGQLTQAEESGASCVHQAQTHVLR
jgi:hypothetical protein